MNIFGYLFVSKTVSNKLSSRQHNMPPPLSSPVGAPAPRAPPSRCKVAVLSHTEYVPTLTAATTLHVKAALSKVAWWLMTFDLLTLKVVSESRVTWATSMPILVFLGLSVLDLGLMYATDVRQSIA